MTLYTWGLAVIERASKENACLCFIDCFSIQVRIWSYTFVNSSNVPHGGHLVITGKINHQNCTAYAQFGHSELLKLLKFHTIWMGDHLTITKYITKWLFLNTSTEWSYTFVNSSNVPHGGHLVITGKINHQNCTAYAQFGHSELLKLLKFHTIWMGDHLTITKYITKWLFLNTSTEWSYTFVNSSNVPHGGHLVITGKINHQNCTAYAQFGHSELLKLLKFLRYEWVTI